MTRSRISGQDANLTIPRPTVRSSRRYSARPRARHSDIRSLAVDLPAWVLFPAILVLVAATSGAHAADPTAEVGAISEVEGEAEIVRAVRARAQSMVRPCI